MRRSEVEQWLDAHGGQKGEARIEYSLDPNPKYDASQAAGNPKYDQTPKERKKHVTWTAKDGQVLEVIDDYSDLTGDEKTAKQKSDPGGFSTPEGYNAPDATYTPDYQVVQQGPPEAKEDTRPPEKKADDAATAAEKEWNRANGPKPDTSSPAYDGSNRGSGIYETHTERAARENSTAAGARADNSQARADRTEARTAKTEAERAKTDKKRVGIEQQRANTEDATATSNAQSNTLQAQTAAAREAREAKGVNTPVGSPTYADPSFTTINTTTGEVQIYDNPNYDKARKESEQKRQEIAADIEAGKYNAEVGAQKYKEWYDSNITIPFAQMQERRAQAADTRAAQDMLDKRKAQKAQNDIDRAKIGQEAAATAQENERALLPYRVGDKFASQFAAATDSLAHGGSLNSDASAGIHFTADAFQFKRPDFGEIAKQATKDALKHLTPYDPDKDAPVVANYTGISGPTAASLATAPAYSLQPIATPYPGAITSAPTSTVPAYTPPAP